MSRVPKKNKSSDILFIFYFLVKKIAILIFLFGFLSNCSNEYLGLNTLNISVGPDINFPLGTVDMTLGNVVGNLGMDTQNDSTGIYIETRLDSVATIYADSLISRDSCRLDIRFFCDGGQSSYLNFNYKMECPLSQFGSAAGGNGRCIDK